MDIFNVSEGGGPNSASPKFELLAVRGLWEREIKLFSSLAHSILGLMKLFLDPTYVIHNLAYGRVLRVGMSQRLLGARAGSLRAMESLLHINTEAMLASFSGLIILD